MALMLALSTVVPGWAEVNGAPISNAELWRSGYAAEMLLIATALFSLPMLFYRRSKWARPAVFVLIPGLFGLSALGEFRSGNSMTIDVIAMAIWIGILYFYLYRSRGVRNYFMG